MGGGYTEQQSTDLQPASPAADRVRAPSAVGTIIQRPGYPAPTRPAPSSPALPGPTPLDPARPGLDDTEDLDGTCRHLQTIPETVCNGGDGTGDQLPRKVETIQLCGRCHHQVPVALPLAWQSVFQTRECHSTLLYVI